jgi:hypothetical protein
VREYVLGDVLEVHSFLPKSVIETGAECAVDLEELVEVGEKELVIVVGEKTCDHEEDFKRKLEERYREM